MKSLNVFKVRFSLLIAASVILSGCVAQAPAAVEQPKTAPTGTAVPIPVSGAEQDATSSLLRSALLSVYSISQSDSSKLLPIDLTTGEIPTGVEPVDFHESSGFAFSPDAKTVVFGSTHEQGCTPTCITIIDLPTWTVRRYALPYEKLIVEWFSASAFNPQGNRVAMGYSTVTGPNGILVFDLGAQPDFQVIPIQQFISRIGFTRDGSALMAYGNLSERNGMSSGGQLSLISLEDNQVAWEKLLPEVKDGQYHTDPAGSPELDAWFMPAVVLSPVSDRLYIAHADEDMLTTVDFDARKVTTVEIKRPQSLLDRLMASTAGVAHAKMINGTMMDGVISPDGKRLYTVGMRSENVLKKNGDREVIREPLGLSAIDTDSGTLADHWQTASTEVRIDPRGRRLFLYDWQEVQGSSLAKTEVFDIQSGKWIPIQGLRSIYPSLLPVGKTVLLSTGMGSLGSLTLSILDPDTLQPVRELKDWNGEAASWLTTP